MSLIRNRGGAGGASYQVYTKQTNDQPAVFTSTANRDSYFSSNPQELVSINNQPLAIGIGTIAEDPSQDNVSQWYAYINGAWETIVATLVGATGLPGDAATVADLSPMHVPIKSPTEEKLIDSGMQATAAGGLYARDLEVSNESIQIGPEILVGDSVSTIGFTRNSDDTSYVIGATQITDAGYDRNTRIRSKELETNIVNGTTDANSPITTPTHTVTYASLQDSLIDSATFSSDGEIDNLNITVIKVVNGVDKSIYPFIPPVSYDENNGIYVVDSLPANPDPNRTYVLRDALTGDFTLNVDHARFSEALEDPSNPLLGPFFKLFMETTDSRGLRLKSRTFELLPGLGSQKVPVLTTTGHDTDDIPTADLRDVYRRYREVDSDVTITTMNDFDRDFNVLLDFTSDATFTYGTTFPWLEGASIEIIGNGGNGTVVINGFTIDGNANITVSDGERLKLTYENGETTDFISNRSTSSEDLNGAQNINNAIRFSRKDSTEFDVTTSPYTRSYPDLGQGITPGGGSISLTNFRAAWMEFHPDAVNATAINITSDIDNDIVFSMDASKLNQDVTLTITQANTVWSTGGTTKTFRHNHVLSAFCHRDIPTVPASPTNPNVIYSHQAAVDGDAGPAFHPDFENTIIAQGNGDDTLDGETFPTAVETLSRARQLLSGETGYKQVWCPDASTFTETGTIILDTGEDLYMPFAGVTADLSGPVSGHCRVQIYKHFGLLGVGTQDQFFIREQSGDITIQGVSHDNTKLVIDDLQSGSIIIDGAATGVLYLEINNAYGGFTPPSPPSGLTIIGRIEGKYIGIEQSDADETSSGEDSYIQNFQKYRDLLANAKKFGEPRTAIWSDISNPSAGDIIQVSLNLAGDPGAVLWNGQNLNPPAGVVVSYDSVSGDVTYSEVAFGQVTLEAGEPTNNGDPLILNYDSGVKWHTIPSIQMPGAFRVGHIIQATIGQTVNVLFDFRNHELVMAYLDAPLSSGSYNLFMSTGSSDGGNGNRAYPFNSLSDALTAAAAIPSGVHKKLNIIGVDNIGGFTNTSTTNNIANFIVDADECVFSSITLADHATTLRARVCNGDIQLADQCTVELSSITNTTSGNITFTGEVHNTTKLSARRMESTVSINFGGASSGSHITIQIDKYDGTDSQLDTILSTIPTGVNVSGWIGNRNLSTNYLENAITYIDTTSQNPSGTDSPMVIEFGSGGSDPSSLVTMSSAGVLTINKAGPYAFPMRAHVARSGAIGDAELFIQMERSTDGGSNWSAISTTSFVSVENSDESLEFFGFQSLFLDSSDQIRFRFARSSNGANDGGLEPVTPPAALVTAGFSSVPSAVLAVYKQSNYPYRA